MRGDASQSRVFSACATVCFTLFMCVAILELRRGPVRHDKIGELRYARLSKMPTVETLNDVPIESQLSKIYPKSVVDEPRNNEMVQPGVSMLEYERAKASNCGQPGVSRVVLSSPEQLNQWSAHLFEAFPDFDRTHGMLWCECELQTNCEGKYCAILHNGWWPVQRNYEGYAFHACNQKGGEKCSCAAVPPGVVKERVHAFGPKNN